MPVSEEIKYRAKMRDEDLFQRINTLNRFGVVGFEKSTQFEETKKFLESNEVPIEFNNRRLIWLPEISDNLKKTFR